MIVTIGSSPALRGAADAQVAIFDATNSTEERRSLLVRMWHLYHALNFYLALLKLL